MSRLSGLKESIEALEEASELLRRYRAILESILGSDLEEAKETLRMFSALNPREIREACSEYLRRLGGRR